MEISDTETSDVGTRRSGCLREQKKIQLEQALGTAHEVMSRRS